MAVAVQLMDATMSLGLVVAAINRLPVDQGSGFTKTYRWQTGAEIQSQIGFCDC